MLFRICAGRGINLLQFPDCKGGFLRIFSFKILIKIRKFRFSLLKLRDNQTHLVTPVAQMNIPDHFIALKPDNPFDTLSDNR